MKTARNPQVEEVSESENEIPSDCVSPEPKESNYIDSRNFQFDVFPEHSIQK